MTHAIRVALDLIAEDLAAGAVPLPRVVPQTWQDRELSESVLLVSADGTGTGVWLDLSLSLAEVLPH